MDEGRGGAWARESAHKVDNKPLLYVTPRKNRNPRNRLTLSYRFARFLLRGSKMYQ